MEANKLHVWRKPCTDYLGFAALTVVLVGFLLHLSESTTTVEEPVLRVSVNKVYISSLLRSRCSELATSLQ